MQGEESGPRTLPPTFPAPTPQSFQVSAVEWLILAASGMVIAEARTALPL